MGRRLRGMFVVCVAVTAIAWTLAAQPRFQSGVELLRISVTVVDNRGEPVRNLTPQDFSVSIDGKPRPVRFAQLYAPVKSETPATPAASPAPLPSYAINTASPPGRVVVLAVDLFALKQGYEKPVLDTAAKLVDALGPNDAVGLMPIPGKGIDLTRDHRAVSDALRILRGTSNVPFIKHFFTLREAVAFEQIDRRTIFEVIERECCKQCTECPQELRDETRELLRFARQHVSTVLTNLSRLATGLQAIDAPKTIVLLSAGLPFEQESLTYFTDLQRALARSGTMMYAVQVEQPENDASNLRRPGVGTYQANDIQTGLANVGTMSGGAFFAGVGTAAGVFDRVRAEIAYSYELGVEALPADDDGKAHAVKVSVSRPSVTVRSRREIIVPETVADAGKKLGNMLAQPVDVAELPVAAAAYSVRGDASDTLKVIISAEIGRDVTIGPLARYALVVSKGNDVVFQTNDTAQTAPGVARAVTAAQLPPGRYRMRVAAVDASGRGGTVELPISVGLRAAGTLQTSDLLVGATEGGFRPSIQVSPGEPLAALLELYSADPARFAQVRVGFELRRTGETQLLAESGGTLRETDFERRQIADAVLDTKDLAPGDYLVSAVISEAGRATGRVSREVRLVPRVP